MTPEPTARYTLALTAEEHGELLRLLEQSLEDIRVERRRTEAPEYHEEVRHEEAILRSLTEKLRRIGG